MNNFKILFSALSFSALAACSVPTVDVAAQQTSSFTQADRQAEVNLRDRYKNPEGLRIRQEVRYRLANGDRALCAELNGTNGFGGYTGYKPGYLRYDGQTGQIKSFLTEFLATSGCEALKKGVVPIRIQP